MRKRPIAAALCTLLAAACAAGPDYRRPAAPASAGEAFVTRAEGIDPASPLPDDWWRLYNDPVLDDLVARAFAANTDLRAASANLAKARAVLSEARAGHLPSTALSAGGGYGDSVQFGGGQGGSAQLAGAQWSGNASASLSWEADLFGRVSRTVEAAQADTQAVEAARDGVRVLVAAETTRAYLGACANAHALEVARESAAASARSRDLVSAQEKAGSAARFDVERAATAAAGSRAAIPALEAQRQVALFELAALLGETPRSIPAAAQACSRPPDLAGAPPLPIGDGAALLRRRPDLREAERRLAADTARIGVATADLYPRISLGGFGGFLRSETVKGSDSLSFSLGPLVSWSFPNMATARTRLRQAEAQGDVALATFDGRVLTALKEVEQALARVAQGQRRLDDLAEAEASAQRAWALADLRYRAGSISLLDLLVAQSAMLEARSVHAAALTQLSSDRVDLFKALGGGWRQESTAESAKR
ncbi:efflux transporter outer membrane subunit [Novosphingobium sp. RL4]|uniref:efflux transporter outer membrane subunit n=1 Tax=Novosphingobium sp. RL4 TaxID=3109595 RepID=UPI002D767375|nr:efflux transporter outer membrane subunit [Novosphingobium sp. RL4]WRT95751.1 efflux transporter outer membrane subunit [Novosphingobium sp. RL4]